MAARLRWLRLLSQTALECSFLLSVAKQNNTNIFKLSGAVVITIMAYFLLILYSYFKCSTWSKQHKIIVEREGCQGLWKSGQEGGFGIPGSPRRRGGGSKCLAIPWGVRGLDFFWYNSIILITNGVVSFGFWPMGKWKDKITYTVGMANGVLDTNPPYYKGWKFYWKRF